MSGSVSGPGVRKSWGLDSGVISSKVQSFVDIMSEEKVKEIQEEDLCHTVEACSSADANDGTCEEAAANSTDDQCANDYLLAVMLQNEFNLEHDQMLLREEKKLNGNEKVVLSFEKYRPTKLISDDESDEDDDDARESRNEKLDSFKKPVFGNHGLIRQDGQLLSKHDTVVCGRDNTSKLLEFPPNILTGDAAKIDLKLSNKVYNSLKAHSLKEGKRRARIHEEKEKSTWELAVDEKTRMILYKMVSSGLLTSISGAISTGKEAVVFHAFGGTWKGSDLPNECVIKIFKTTLNEFKNRAEYVQNDYRFRNPRKVLKVWAERELINLNRLKRANIKCPDPIKLRNHLLLMSFVGEDQTPAPKLKEVDLDCEQMSSLYCDCISVMQKMLKECGLVHGDLSEFNLLYWQNELWVIDVAQAMDISHPRSLLFLARDCQNITEFFMKRGVETMSVRELFNKITDLRLESDDGFFSDVEKLCDSCSKTQLNDDKKNPADCILRSEDGRTDSEDFRTEVEMMSPSPLLIGTNYADV